MREPWGARSTDIPYRSFICLQRLSKDSGETWWQSLSTCQVMTYGEHTELSCDWPVVDLGSKAQARGRTYDIYLKGMAPLGDVVLKAEKFRRVLCGLGFTAKALSLGFGACTVGLGCWTPLEQSAAVLSQTQNLSTSQGNNASCKPRGPEYMTELLCPTTVQPCSRSFTVGPPFTIW